MGSAKKKHQAKIANRRNSKKLRKILKKNHSKKIDNTSVINVSNLHKSLLNTKELISTPATKTVQIQTLKPYAPTIIKEDIKTRKKCCESNGMGVALATKEKTKPSQTLSNDEVYFCKYMLDKHVDNYKAMARDIRNVHKLTPKKIRETLRKFKRSKNNYESFKTEKRTQEECFTMLQKLNTDLSSFGHDKRTMTSAMET